jgi:hypothetical protein
VVPRETADADAVGDCGWAESRWEGGSTAVIWCSGGRSHGHDGDPAKEESLEGEATRMSRG